MGSDMDRLGIFQEMSYITINEPYISEKPGITATFTPGRNKGRQMFGAPFYQKSSLDQGYFQSPFVRIFEAEAYFNKAKALLAARNASENFRIGKHWMPSGPAERLCGVGSDAGAFGKRERFDPSVKTPKGAAGSTGDKKEKLFLTSPGKKGTGYGYLDVCIGPYPAHEFESEQYHEQRRMKERKAFAEAMQGRRPFNSSHPPRPFFSQPEFLDFNSIRPVPTKAVLKPFTPTNPGKMPGGMHAGTFSPFERLSEPYAPSQSRYLKDVVNSEGKLFMPIQGPKSVRQKSLMQAYHQKKMNRMNYKFYKKKWWEIKDNPWHLYN